MSYQIHLVCRLCGSEKLTRIIYCSKLSYIQQPVCCSIVNLEHCFQCYKSNRTVFEALLTTLTFFVYICALFPFEILCIISALFTITLLSNHL